MFEHLPKWTVASCLDILIVAFLIYQSFMIIQGRRAAQVVTGLWILGLAYYVSVWARLELLRSILTALAPYTAFGLIVMFQSDIRRLLARLGLGHWLSFGGHLERRELIDELLLAVNQLSAQKTGALIVIEREVGLRSFIESGVVMDAKLSRDLLLAIFEPGAALHDGAVVVQGDRVAAATCFLPLTMNPVLVGTLGTRHRAAIGVTEETDCLALVVAERTGRISLAAAGEIELGVTPEQIEERLTQHVLGRSLKRTAAPNRASERTRSAHGS